MPRPATSWGRALAILALGGLSTSGCTFFQELESAPGAVDTDTESSTESDTESGTTEASTGNTDTGGPCELPVDDRCLDQDTVASCNPGDGLVSEVDCVATCGSLTNFSCVATASGQHACWCVEPGSQKTLSCAQLEDCIGGCDLTQSLECADRCFSRTDALTARIYGALVHCAQATCQPACQQTSNDCLACIDAARIEGSGGCSLPRAICDDDRNPDEPWP